MFSWLSKRDSSNRFAGIAVQRSGCAVAVIRALSNGHMQLEHVAWSPTSAEKNLSEALPPLLSEAGIKSTPTTVLLPHDGYSLLQLEVPDVPEDERQDALRWRVRDMVDFSVETAVVDHFLLPKSKRPGAPELLYAVATPDSAVAEVVEPVLAAKVDLQAVDIPEMGLRDLVRCSEDLSERPVAYLALTGSVGVIQICRGDEICLTRQIPFASAFTQMEASELTRQMESLALEVQRSLDYFESQYAMGAVDHLAVMSCSAELERHFLETATLYLTVPAQRFELTSIENTEAFDNDLLRYTLLAIGAAMRDRSCLS